MTADTKKREAAQFQLKAGISFSNNQQLFANKTRKSQLRYYAFSETAL